jgi:hypothetical protein
MVEELHRKAQGGAKTSVKAKGEGGGEKPPEPTSSPLSLSPSSSSFDESEHSSHKKKPSHPHDLPLLKLDVKFELSIYDGELNAKKLENWVKQIEVYCSVQKTMDDVAKIQLATLHLGGTTLIWWESTTQCNLIQHGKVISSWDEFIAALRKQLYPLAYMQMTIIYWQHLRQGKGQNVQVYT